MTISWTYSTDAGEQHCVVAEFVPEERRSFECPGHPAYADVEVRDATGAVMMLSDAEYESLEREALERADDADEQARDWKTDRAIDVAREGGW